ncbi:21225_t:CDS:2 [Entrophospora sp. SA101]|nr:21225_t:CDS:2 [Entrophospora sp. SA101]
MSYTRGSSNGFFEMIRRLLTVNPENSNTGVHISGIYRSPAPASQPPTYKSPLTKHSDLAKNYYFSRDYRRHYPRLAVFTQNDVAGLISASNFQSVTSGDEGGVAGSGGGSDKSTDTQVINVLENLSLTETIASAPKLYSEDKLPPTPGNPSYYKWKLSEDAPKPEPGVYWPIKQFS